MSPILSTEMDNFFHIISCLDVVLSFSGILVVYWLRKRSSKVYRGKRFLKSGTLTTKFSTQRRYNIMFGNEKNVPSKPEPVTPIPDGVKEQTTQSPIVTKLLKLSEIVCTHVDVDLANEATSLLLTCLNHVLLTDLEDLAHASQRKIEKLNMLRKKLAYVQLFSESIRGALDDVQESNDSMNTYSEGGESNEE